ncbi:hypothetical protein N9937_01740 [bacterium]|nr:hypothetical protein [bacterium]
MTATETDAANAAAHMLGFAGESVTVAGQQARGFVIPDSVISSAIGNGGKAITQALELTVSKVDFPQRPKLRTRANVRGGVFYIQNVTDALGTWDLELNRDKGR